MDNKSPISIPSTKPKTAHLKRLALGILDFISERIPFGKQAIVFVKGGVEEMTRTGLSFLVICVVLVAGPSAILCYNLGWHKGWSAYENFAGDALLKEIIVMSPSERGKKYDDLFSQNKGDAKGLVMCGMDSFRAGDYPWTVKFYQESELHVWDDACRVHYPFYAAALILLNRQDEGRQQFKQMIQFIDGDISARNGYLRYPGALGALSQDLSEVRKRMPDDEKTYIDTVQDLVDQRIEQAKRSQGVN